MEPVRLQHADYLCMGQWAVITFYVVMILYAVMRRSKPVRGFARRLFMRLQRQAQRNARRGTATATLLLFAGIFSPLTDTLGSSLRSFFKMTGYWMGFLLSMGLTYVCHYAAGAFACDG
ncbi:MAG: hypothetical protein KatS3mg023_3480 [Armatimonadota bacterium]|nr:MAG: hypothetical protein KatS3mg023_3480 [Armatimonadota bacterium]